MLFVVGAMAALAIDVVTFYTARSEAQLAADSAALAGARVLANSGITSLAATSSNLTTAITAAETLASSVATQVAQQNLIEGTSLFTDGTVNVSFSNDATPNNPHVIVQIQRTDLPTFFARIWGTTQVTVAASATAEAYNPSGLTNGSSASLGVPVAPSCVKPWLLPNLDPTSTTGGTIFSPLDGSIQNSALLGLEIVPPNTVGTYSGLQSACTGGSTCLVGNTPQRWSYYPGDPSSFPPPSAFECSGCTTSFQKSIAGCVQTPISCNQSVNIDVADAENWNADAITALNALTHASAVGAADSINLTASPGPTQLPFQFYAGTENPLVLGGTLQPLATTMVSDSLVTVPVFDNSVWPQNFPSVQVVGFVQLFLNPEGNPAPNSTTGLINTSIINLVGCGASATGNNVLGNGGSAVPVRLITPP